ncbi:hypothetical protein ACFW1A_04635 [Kitasatospora sp. NPDC058965]|uniref:hypothetical protein n=1 Tax=Kitasatospora sp. NPDC058965 TaxID=3346682 RepID=UPI0036C2481D
MGVVFGAAGPPGAATVVADRSGATAPTGAGRCRARPVRFTASPGRGSDGAGVCTVAPARPRA